MKRMDIKGEKRESMYIIYGGLENAIYPLEGTFHMQGG